MTVEHLLTMSSGFDCDDWDGSRPGSEDKLLDDQPDADYYRYLVIACYGGNYADRAGWLMVREYIPKFILAAIRD